MPDYADGWNQQAENKTQLSRFVISDGLSVLNDYSAYQCLTTHNSSIGIAKGLSCMAVMAFGFIVNKCWIFRSTRRPLSECTNDVSFYASTPGVNVSANAVISRQAAGVAKVITLSFAT